MQCEWRWGPVNQLIGHIPTQKRPTLPGNYHHPTLPLGVALNCPSSLFTQMSRPSFPLSGWSLLKESMSWCGIAFMQQGNKEAKGWGAEEVLLFKPNWNLSPSVKLGKTEKEFSFKMNRETYGLSGVIFLDPFFFFSLHKRDILAEWSYVPTTLAIEKEKPLES